MAVNFNTAFYQNSSYENKVERVVNPKSAAVDDKKLANKSTAEQALQISQYQQHNQVVKADKAAIELFEQQRQALQNQQQQNNQKTSYDNPSRNTAKALNAYQQVADDEKRQAFASLVGVDIYV